MKIYIEQTDGQETKPSWANISWQGVGKNVRRLQERIYRATQEGAWKKVRSLQKLLLRATSNKLLSIRQVTQENQGRKTPGIDGVVYNSPSKRMALSNEMKGWQEYRPQAVRRIYIPKGEGKERPLGIPTQKDRVRQAMLKRVLEPEWEAKFETNSYGFRPGRSVQDAISQISRTLHSKRSSQWVLDADIKGCFDNIAHKPLLDKLTGSHKQIVARWLKAGIVEEGRHQQTPQGTPQGGIISPLLANIALDGIERIFGAQRETGRYISPSLRKGQNKGVSLIRYADDFVVTAPSQEVIQHYILPKIKHFLASRGLSLNETKTRIVHISQGFNFLGFTIKKYKHRLIISPQKEKVKQHLTQIKTIIDSNKQTPAYRLINKLNPIIRGWTNYYRHFNASQCFKYLSYRYWLMLWQWAKRRHPNKSKHWIKQRYFKVIGNRKWVFAEDKAILLDPGQVRKRPYCKVKGASSPFDPALRAYWHLRHQRSLLQTTPSNRKRFLLKRQNFQCDACKLPFLSLDTLVLHHIIPKHLGGSNALHNCCLLHSHCHIQLHQRSGFRVLKA